MWPRRELPYRAKVRRNDDHPLGATGPVEVSRSVYVVQSWSKSALATRLPS